MVTSVVVASVDVDGVIVGSNAVLYRAVACRAAYKRSHFIDAIRRRLFARIIVPTLKVEFLSQHENTRKILSARSEKVYTAREREREERIYVRLKWVLGTANKIYAKK